MYAVATSAYFDLTARSWNWTLDTRESNAYFYLYSSGTEEMNNMKL